MELETRLYKSVVCVFMPKGVKGNSDNVTKYDVFFFEVVPYLNRIYYIFTRIYADITYWVEALENILMFAYLV